MSFAYLPPGRRTSPRPGSESSRRAPGSGVRRRGRAAFAGAQAARLGRSARIGRYGRDRGRRGAVAAVRGRRIASATPVRLERAGSATKRRARGLQDREHRDVEREADDCCGGGRQRGAAGGTKATTARTMTTRAATASPRRRQPQRAAARTSIAPNSSAVVVASASASPSSPPSACRAAQATGTWTSTSAPTASSGSPRRPGTKSSGNVTDDADRDDHPRRE